MSCRCDTCGDFGTVYVPRAGNWYEVPCDDCAPPPRSVAATMPPSAEDALAEAAARRMAQEGEAGVRFDLLMARLEESAQNREDANG